MINEKAEETKRDQRWKIAIRDLLMEAGVKNGDVDSLKDKLDREINKMVSEFKEKGE